MIWFSTVVVATVLYYNDLTAFCPRILDGSRRYCALLQGLNRIFDLKRGLAADFTPCFCERKNILDSSQESRRAAADCGATPCFQVVIKC